MRNRKLLQLLKARSDAATASVSESFGINPTDSLAARVGAGFIRLAVVAEFAAPVLVFGLMLVGSAVETVAQTPGGNIFGQSAETPGRGLVEAVKYFRNVIFVLGVVFFGWAGINMGMEKPWGGKALGGAACWGFAGLSALVYNFSQGQAVNLDTNLGN